MSKCVFFLIQTCFFPVCVSQGHIMAQGTYSELQRSDLDIVSLLKSNEEHEQWARSADPDKLSLHSRRTTLSHSSHCSYSSLLPPEINWADQIPVGTFPKYNLIFL